MPRLLTAVTPEDLQAAVRCVRRLGNAAALERLERREPELTELLLTEASRVHRRLCRQRLPPPLVRQLTRRIETLGITLVFAAALAALRATTPRRPMPPDPVL